MPETILTGVAIREHYDLPSCSEEKPRRPNNGQQERFDVLVGTFLSEISLNMEGIAEEFPTVGRAQRQLVSYLALNPGVAFRRFSRPEVLQETVGAGERVCPR